MTSGRRLRRSSQRQLGHGVIAANLRGHYMRSVATAATAAA
jgi:hypothetical protein